MIGDGSHSVPFSRCWIDFDGGSGTGNGGASLQTVTLTRSNLSIENLADTANVMWQITSDRTGWSEAEVTFKYLSAEIEGLWEESIEVVEAYIKQKPDFE